MKILIVDDRAENRLLLQEQLRGIDADAVTAESGVRALRELRTRHFDLVVSDLLMPEMDGFQLCYLLKTDPKLKKTPVVIYTANYATKKDEEQAKSLGADDFITRPIDEEILTARIQQVMHQAQAGRIAEPSSKPEAGFFREYSSLLIEKLEDQLITAEENARLKQELEQRNTDLTRANQELLRVNQDLEAYSYSVSHDLRAPVRAIDGMVRALLDEISATVSPEGQRYIERIQHNVARMEALINGLLDHYRMRSAGDSMVRVDLDRAAAQAVANHDFVARAAGARIQVAPGLPAVMAHEQALIQILTNLVDNALKFVARGVAPDIRIGAERIGERVRVTVTDNGIGIAAEDREKVFNVFERLQGEDRYPGTGLGLAIVRRGIEKMGGTVGVSSAPNQGSTFWFELKAAAD